MDIKEFRVYLTYIILSVVSFISPVVAQNESHGCFRIGVDTYCGFINKNGEVVQYPKYEYCSQWCEGFIWVRDKLNDYFSGRFINEFGAVIAKESFGGLRNVYFEMPDPFFRDGVAVVSTRLGKYAYIDASGNILGFTAVPLFFAKLDRDILAVCHDNKYGYIYKNGDLLTPMRYSDARPFRNSVAAVKIHNKWGLIGHDGEFLIKPKYDDIDWFRYESKFWKFKSNNLWGMVNLDGVEVIPSLYTSIDRCANGVIAVHKDDKQLIIPLNTGMPFAIGFEDIRSLGKEFILAKWKGKWGAISHRGKVIINPRFDDAFEIQKDCFYEVKEGNRIGFLNKTGEIICEPRFNQVLASRAGIIPVRQDGKWGLLDVSGEMLVEPRYTSIKGFSSFSDGVAIVEEGDKCGLWSITTKDYIVPLKYDDIIRWNDLFATSKDNIISLFDISGVEILTKNNAIRSLPEPHAMLAGFGVVRTKLKSGIINSNGQVVIPLEYDDTGIPSEGMIPVKSGDKWGYIDMNGSVVIRPQFSMAASFRHGVAAVKSGGKYGYINKVGNSVVNPIYSAAGYSFHGLLPVAKENADAGFVKWGLIDHKGKVVLPLEYDCLEWCDIADGTVRYYGVPGWQHQ